MASPFAARLTEADGESAQRLIEALNRILAELGDRLDAIEGTRGTATIQTPLRVVDADGNILHSYGGSS